ncbi:Basic helix-loop-helix transcription factor [Melia azedarach]|uniref:Basic helix-loop-helix transcription factor n=1 Tax=Melia azedarach TaxID=155640 RepID=A0ACC1YN96_MELAZ|nr:Basic helix-loop-helix transcription factor [Melia azedarach]
MPRRTSSASRAQRNMKEKNRRMVMRDLLLMLASLIPPQPSKLSVSELVDRAISYIMQLQKKIENLKRRRALLRGDHATSSSSSRMLPIMNLTTMDSTLEVNLICGLTNRNFMWYEIISVLEDEGAEVIDATQLNTGNRIIYIIKSKAIISRIGFEISRVQERLQDLIL